MEYTSIPAIVIICYLIAEAIKLFTDKANKYIPVICGFSGAILAVLAFYLTPGFIPATNVFEAIAIGIVSGLAATGANQIYKQLVEKE